MTKKTVKKSNAEVLMALQLLNQSDISEILESMTVSDKLRVRGVFTALAEAYKEYDEQRIALVDQYGKKDEEGNVISEGDVAIIEDEKTFNEEGQKLLDAENSVPIPVVSYGGLKSTKLPFRFITAFDGIFVE